MSDEHKPMNPATAYLFKPPPEQWAMLEELVSMADTDRHAREILAKIACSYLGRTNTILTPPHPPPATWEELRAMGGSWGYGGVLSLSDRLPAPLAEWVSGVLEGIGNEGAGDGET